MQKHLVNREIRTPGPLMVIGPDGTKYNGLSRVAAFDLAAQHGLDIVLMSEAPPVAKLMDYGKWLFEEKKKSKERTNDPEFKRKQAFNDIKEVTLSYKIADHDFEVCVDKIKRFLEKGHRVRCSIRLRGREVRHHELASAVLRKLAAQSQGKIEKSPSPEGNKIFMVIAP
jgi:translation initiation factor IF-3